MYEAHEETIFAVCRSQVNSRRGWVIRARLQGECWSSGNIK